jgi:O-antigen/teichoic acid export membrane protein
MSYEISIRIAKNSLYNLIRIVVAIPLTLIITPYIIVHLGKEEFGIWALVGVISSYAQLSDFGVTESLIKFMAEDHAHQDAERLNHLVNTALVVYLLLSLLCIIVALVILPFIVNTILNIPEALQHKAMQVFTVSIMLFCVNMTIGIFGALITGFQRLDLSNMISLFASVISACGVFYFLSKGYGLYGLIYNNIIITIVVATFNIFISRKLFPQLLINPMIYSRMIAVRRIFQFSWKIQVSNISQLMIFQVDRILLSHYVGLAAVSNYEIANRLASQARMLIASLFSPLLPAASALHATDEHDRVLKLYRRSFKYMSTAAIPLSFLIIALAHPFIRTWMGPGYDTSAYTLQLLMIAFAVNLLTGPGGWILNGINKPHIGMRSSLMAGTVNILLCLTLVRYYGYYGVVASISLSLITSALYFTWMLQRNIDGMDWSVYKESLMKPLLFSGILMLAVLFLDVFTLKGFGILVCIGSLYAVLVAALLRASGYFDEFDRALFAKVNPFNRILKHERT